MSASEFGERNGHLTYLDWDQAVVDHIGSLLDTKKNQYYLPLGIYVGNDPIERAFVVYKKPEPTQAEMDLPLIVINRDDVTTTPERLYTIAQQYRVPAEGSKAVSASGCVGATEYEQKEQERPYDFIYTIEVWSRYRSVAQMLLLMMQAKFPTRGSITVTDSLQCGRIYATYEEGIADLTEVQSLVDRIVGYALTIRMEGELTIDRMPKTFEAFTGDRTNDPVPGVNDDDPDPGPGGLYADGAADITIDVIDDC